MKLLTSVLYKINLTNLIIENLNSINHVVFDLYILLSLH